MTKNPVLVLRLGLAFVFIYAAYASFLRPGDWIGFIPAFVDNFIDRKIFLQIHEAYNILLAIWLLSNVKVFYAAILSALTLAGIVVFNFGALDIVFRDIGLLTAAVSLALLTKPNR